MLLLDGIEILLYGVDGFGGGGGCEDVGMEWRVMW